MEQYTIYCSEEQTKKALGFGAPIEYHCPNEREKVYHNPTTEQMIGWLEEQFFSFDIFQPFVSWSYSIQYKDKVCALDDGYHSRKEATIAAIDAALDYLSKNK